MGRQRRSRKGANPLAQYRTLAVYLESLEGSLVDVEFQNDIVIRGKLVSVDASIKCGHPIGAHLTVLCADRPRARAAPQPHA